MKWTIFSRLVFGYLLIAFLVLAMSGYAVFELGQVERIAYSILQTDNRIMDLEKKITDSMLSQMRYEQKFVITKDRELYQQFLLAQNDFHKFTREAMIAAGSSDPKNLVEALTANQKAYEALFAEEVKFIQDNLPYDLQKYKREKEKTIDLIMADLRALEAAAQKGAFEKIRELNEAGANASKVAISLAVSALVGVILVSLFITRSITLPLEKLIEKTREISNWVFKADLNLSSPPEIQELARAINSMCEKLKTVDKMKSDFISTMAHELRTPLTSIKGALQLLVADATWADPDQRTLVDVALSNAERLIRIINDILDISKIEAGKIELNPRPCEPAELVRLSLQSVEAIALGASVTIVPIVSPRTPKVMADPDRTVQAMVNLLSNALKYAPPKSEVLVEVQPAGIGQVRFAVTDRGRGIPQEKLGQLFQKFHQVDGADTRRFRGTGLGLAITKALIEMQGGQVFVESEPGKGSTFAITIPVAG